MFPARARTLHRPRATRSQSPPNTAATIAFGVRMTSTIWPRSSGVNASTAARRARRDVPTKPATISTNTASAAAARAGGDRRNVIQANSTPAIASAASDSTGISPVDAIVHSRTANGSAAASLRRTSPSIPRDRNAEDEPQRWLQDEEGVSEVPRVVERIERMDAVTVQSVEREVAGQRNCDEQPETHAPRQPHLAHGREKPDTPQSSTSASATRPTTVCVCPRWCSR